MNTMIEICFICSSQSSTPVFSYILSTVNPILFSLLNPLLTPHSLQTWNRLAIQCLFCTQYMASHTLQTYQCLCVCLTSYNPTSMHSLLRLALSLSAQLALYTNIWLFIYFKTYSKHCSPNMWPNVFNPTPTYPILAPHILHILFDNYKQSTVLLLCCKYSNEIRMYEM
jgi:hypothetical protein